MLGCQRGCCVCDGGRGVLVARLVEMVVVVRVKDAVLGRKSRGGLESQLSHAPKRDAQASPPRARTSALPSSLIQSSHTDCRHWPESLRAGTRHPSSHRDCRFRYQDCKNDDKRHVCSLRRTNMAGTKFAYVKKFELPDNLLPETYIVVRIDGHAFHRCVRPHRIRAVPNRRASDCRRITVLRSRMTSVPCN